MKLFETPKDKAQYLAMSSLVLLHGMLVSGTRAHEDELIYDAFKLAKRHVDAAESNANLIEQDLQQ